MIYLDGRKVEIEHFPNGEVRIDAGQLAGESDGILRMHFNDDSDLVHLMMLVGHIRQSTPRRSLSLFIDYLPYSRMDRQTKDVFTLRSVANMINQMEFTQVILVEPHSDVSCALIERARAVYPSAGWLLEQALELTEFRPERDVLFFPDAGAQKRYDSLRTKYRCVSATKHRDTHGGLSEYRINTDESVEKGARILIVDDLCSFGGTFLLGAQALCDKYDGISVGLVVTHLENSIYQGKLLSSGLVDLVVATNSICEEPRHEMVHLYDVVTQRPVGGAA